MKNPFRIVLNAFFNPEEHDEHDKEEIKAAEKAGEEAATKVEEAVTRSEKRNEVVPRANVPNPKTVRSKAVNKRENREAGEER